MVSHIQDNKTSKIIPEDKDESKKNLHSTVKTYEAFNTPSPSGNMLPEGSGQNTAGAIGRQEVPSLFEAFKTVRWQDFKQVHAYPCSRDSFLIGIGSAFGMGGIRIVFGAPIPKAANWAVGTFTLAAIASYEICQAKRSFEKMQIKKVVEVMDQKKIEKKEKESVLESRRIEQRNFKENEDKKESREADWGKWKFW